MSGASAGEQTGIAALMGAAFDAAREQPTPERLIEIDTALRAEIARLQATASALAERRPVRSRGWYALVGAVDAAEFALGFQCRDGLAGALNVAEFARRIRELEKAIES